jgi:hypothetical protein
MITNSERIQEYLDQQGVRLVWLDDGMVSAWSVTKGPERGKWITCPEFPWTKSYDHTPTPFEVARDLLRDFSSAFAKAATEGTDKMTLREIHVVEIENGTYQVNTFVSVLRAHATFIRGRG